MVSKYIKKNTIRNLEKSNIDKDYSKYDLKIHCQNV